MTTRKGYRCGTCQEIVEVGVPLKSDGVPPCPSCGQPMVRYFGGPESLPLVNYGYRESRYTNDVDARIAQFQFTNLG
jgi:DNA-directed RNA polymerase subunit RPC12/RpoP